MGPLFTAGDDDAGGSNAYTGPIILAGARLSVGLGASPDSSMVVSGGVSFDSLSSYSTYIDDNGGTPGADFPQLRATGNIALGGTLSIAVGNEAPSGGEENGPCPTLVPGDSATIITTSGTITRTFSNAPNGSVIALTPCTGAAPVQAQITYTAHTVTATIAAATTTSLSSVTPSRTLTNQRVTITAQVRTPSGAPDAQSRSLTRAARSATAPPNPSSPARRSARRRSLPWLPRRG